MDFNTKFITIDQIGMFKLSENQKINILFEEF